MSGKAWDAACDPRASNVPTEEGWADCLIEIKRRGRGYTYTYSVNPPTASLIASHLRMLGEGFMYAPDPESRAEGRACLVAAERIEGMVARETESATP